MSSPSLESQITEDVYHNYDSAISTLGLDQASEALVKKVVSEFAALNPPVFKESEPVFNFLINFVNDYKQEITNQDEGLKMKFTEGLFEVLGINAPEILNAYKVLMQNNFDWKSIDLSKIRKDEIDSLLNRLNIPYLTKNDFLLGIAKSRLDGAINDFVAVKLAGGIINFLNLLNMKLILTKK